jgi:hypothetical protein
LFFLETHTLRSEFFRKDRRVAKITESDNRCSFPSSIHTASPCALSWTASRYGKSHTRHRESAILGRQDGSYIECQFPSFGFCKMDGFT